MTANERKRREAALQAVKQAADAGAPLSAAGDLMGCLLTVFGGCRSCGWLAHTAMPVCPPLHPPHSHPPCPALPPVLTNPLHSPSLQPSPPLCGARPWRLARLRTE